VAEESGHRILAPPSHKLVVSGDGQLLTQMIVNLVENAVRHTPSGTRIVLGLEPQPGWAVLTVTDDGPGIAVKDRARALDRFGRLSEGAKGHGFGLPLVASIARLHGGGLELADAGPGQGLKVTVRLPMLHGEQ